MSNEALRNQYLDVALNGIEGNLEFTPSSIELLNGIFILGLVHITEDSKVIIKDGIQIENQIDYETGDLLTSVHRKMNPYSDDVINRLSENAIQTIAPMNERAFEFYTRSISNLQSRIEGVEPDSEETIETEFDLDQALEGKNVINFLEEKSKIKH